MALQSPLDKYTALVQLDDGETFSGMECSYVLLIHPDAEAQYRKDNEGCDPYEHAIPEEVAGHPKSVAINIEDLVECWFAHHTLPEHAAEKNRGKEKH